MISVTIALIICLTSVVCALPGMFLVLRGVALLSDAISHSILLGIVIMFLIVGNLSSPLLFVGACIAGLATVISTEMLIMSKRLKQDAAISLVFPFFFSLGVILVSKYVRNAHLDVDMILLGEIALAPFRRLIIAGHDMGPIALWVLPFLIIVFSAGIFLFFRPLLFGVFDHDTAQTCGQRPQLFYYILMAMTSITAVAAFDIVGAIVVVALMVTPAAAAYVIASTMQEFIGYTMAIALGSSISGYGIAAYANVSVAGTVAVCCGVIFLYTILIAPKKGIIASVRGWHRSKMRIADSIIQEHRRHHPDSTVKEIANQYGWSLRFVSGRMKKIRTTNDFKKDHV